MILYMGLEHLAALNCGERKVSDEKLSNKALWRNSFCPKLFKANVVSITLKYEIDNKLAMLMSILTRVCA